MSKSIKISRKLKVVDTVDVVVVGGGSAGTTAAIAAAQKGCRTVLVEKCGYLGGLATGGLVLELDGYSNGQENICPAIGDHLAQEMLRRGFLYQGSGPKRDMFDPEGLKLISQQQLLASGVKLYLHTYVTDVINEDGKRIQGVVIDNISGKKVILAKVVIDATGDGIVMAQVGCSHRVESQGIGLNYRVGNIDFSQYPRYMSERGDEYFALRQEIKAKTGDNIHIVPDFYWEKGVCWINVWTASKDMTLDGAITDGECQGRENNFVAFEMLKKNVPGFKEAIIMHTASHLGVRKTRLLEGMKTVLGEEMENGILFDDAGGSFGHPARNGKKITFPIGCLVPKDVNGLLVSGRHVSTDSQGQDLLRVIGGCWATGEAAGNLAAESIGAGAGLRDYYLSNKVLP